VAQGDLVDRVRAAVAGLVRVLSRADPEHHARPVARADDHVLRPGRAVDEVPAAQRPFLALHDQHRLAREDEEVLLVRLPVVHPDRLARAEDEQRDPELREQGLGLLVGPAGEREAVAAPFAVTPARLAGVEDEPALACGREPRVGLLEPRLRNHGA
jgi:hypothetical protein